MVDALEKMIEYKGDNRIFNVGTGVEYSTNDIIAFLENYVGKSFSSITRLSIRKCDVLANSLDISDTISELGWKPEVELELGIKKLIDLFLCQ